MVIFATVLFFYFTMHDRVTRPRSQDFWPAEALPHIICPSEQGARSVPSAWPANGGGERSAKGAPSKFQTGS